MQALVYNGPGEVKMTGVPRPQIGPGQARVRINRCALSDFDLGVYRGENPRARPPLIPGHEFIGVVEETAPEVEGVAPGDRVAVYPLVVCGQCPSCRSSSFQLCQKLQVLGADVDGGLAEYAVAPEEALFILPPTLSETAAAMIEPLASVIRSLHQSRFVALDSALIIGAGAPGLLTGLMLREGGASRIVIADADPRRLALAGYFGLEPVDLSSADLTDYLSRVTDGQGVDTAYECGGPLPLLSLIRLVKAGGDICLTSVTDRPQVINPGDVAAREVRLTGARYYSRREFESAVLYAEMLGLELEKMVTHIVPLSEAAGVFDLMADTDLRPLKVQVDCRA